MLITHSEASMVDVYLLALLLMFLSLEVVITFAYNKL